MFPHNITRIAAARATDTTSSAIFRVSLFRLRLFPRVEEMSFVRVPRRPTSNSDQRCQPSNIVAVDVSTPLQPDQFERVDQTRVSRATSVFPDDVFASIGFPRRADLVPTSPTLHGEPPHRRHQNCARISRERFVFGRGGAWPSRWERDTHLEARAGEPIAQITTSAASQQNLARHDQIDQRPSSVMTPRPHRTFAVLDALHSVQ